MMPSRAAIVRSGLLAICAVAVALPSPAAARNGRHAQQRVRRDAVTIVAARYVETYLRDVPVKLVTVDLTFERASFVSLGYERVLLPRFNFLGKHNSLEFEVQLVKHLLGQQHIEGTIAVVGRTGEIGLIGASSLNIALAPGFSYATKRPAFEFGAQGPSGGNRGKFSKQFQFYLGVEIEFTPVSGSRLHLVGKLHHRSGGYGVISSQRTGSNYLGIGLRFDLRRR